MTFNDYEVTTMIVFTMVCVTALIVHFNPSKEKKIKRTLEEQMSIDEMPTRIAQTFNLIRDVWELEGSSHQKLNMLLKQTKKKEPRSARKRSPFKKHKPSSWSPPRLDDEEINVRS